MRGSHCNRFSKERNGKRDKIPRLLGKNNKEKKKKKKTDREEGGAFVSQ